MARGDLIAFNEALAFMLDGGWESTDDIKCAVCDNTVTPSQTTASPALGDFTEVGTAGSYVAGGTSLGTWGSMVSQSGAIATIDSATNPSWAQHASNDTDAYWGVLYNDTQAGDPAFAYVDLGGPVNMTAGTGFSVTAGSNPGITVGDMLVAYAALRSDAATQSAIGVTATSATIAAFTESPTADLVTTSGGDMAMSGGYAACTAGTATAAPVYASTLAAAHTGSAYIMRLREAADTFIRASTLPMMGV